MSLRRSVILAMALGCLASSQGQSDEELARLLANDSTRQGTVAKILASGDGRLSLMLSWARKPPAQVDEYGLNLGLAEVFCQTKTKEAIPFLIRNIGLKRTRDVDLAPWSKAPEVVEWIFPAVAALIRIGPEASRALIRASQNPMPVMDEDRLAAIFVVARIKDVPEARGFLTAAAAEANMELQYAMEGLRLFRAK